KRNLFKIDVRAQKDEEKVFMRTAWMIDRLTLQNNFLMVNCSLCEITAEKYEARQQVVIYSSNLCCLGENPLHESGFFKPLFPQKI
ncbi:TPA: hypothetical protein ACGYRS_001021, partial [Streptococcus pyogenes]